MKYRVHRLDLNRARDEDRLEQYLNMLKGEVIAIIPNIIAGSTRFLLIVEKKDEKDNDGNPALMLKQRQNMKKRILIYILFLVLAVFILWVATLISEFFGLS